MPSSQNISPRSSRKPGFLADLRVFASLLALSLRSIPQRKALMLVVAVGVGVTVGIVVAVLAMAQSLTSVLRSGADASRAIVLSEGASWEGQSYLPKESMAMVSLSPCIAATPGGNADVSPVALAAVTLYGPGESVRSMAIRGYRADWFEPRLRLVAGRWPKAGLHELAVGQWAAQAIDRASLGEEILVNAHKWPVVGVFESDTPLGGVFVADAESVLDEYGRAGYQAAVATLTEDCDASALQDDLKTRGLNVAVISEVDYAAQSAEALDTFRTLTLVVAVPMSLGAVFCIFGVAATAVHGRRRSIGVLCAIGFGPSAVAAALVVEFMLVAGACALLACVAVSASMAGELITFGVGGTSLTFEWQSGGSLYWTALALAGVASLLGACVPAMRAVRMPVGQVLNVR